MANVVYSLLKNKGDIKACVEDTGCPKKTIDWWRQIDPEFDVSVKQILTCFNPVNVEISKDLEEANNIVLTACKILGLDYKLIATSKDEEYMEAIQMSVHIIRRRVVLHNEKKVSYKRLAYLLNRKQHGTVMNAEITCHDLLKVNKVYKAKYEAIITELNTEKSKTLNS